MHCGVIGKARAHQFVELKLHPCATDRPGCRRGTWRGNYGVFECGACRAEDRKSSVILIGSGSCDTRDFDHVPVGIYPCGALVVAVASRTVEDRFDTGIEVSCLG